jgi:hypothetical protein
LVGVAEQIREVAERHCGVFEVVASTVAPHVGHDVLKAEAPELVKSIETLGW